MRFHRKREMSRSPRDLRLAKLSPVRPLRALQGYLAAVFLGAAAVAPWIYLAVRRLAPGSGLAHQPFHRYVSRCLLVRGAVFSALRRGVPFWFAAAASGGVYALVHFFERPPAPAEVHALTGFLVLGQLLGGFLDPHAVFPGLLTLALAGGLLAWAR